MLSGLAPWIVYWVLVGNVPLGAAVLVALGVALALALGTALLGGRGDSRVDTLEIGSVATFSVLALLTFTVDEAFLLRWILPLSIAGLLLVTLVGALIGRPFARGVAAAEQPSDVVNTELFGGLVTALTRIWVVALAGMTASSAIPPIAAGNSTLHDTTRPLSFIGYWILPFAILGLAALASRFLPGRMLAGIDDVVRETSFVAYDEATIDELYYLAQEHANREVGPGKEAYNVKVGGMGTPLTGDGSRKSWPSSYKVRDKRR